jgi:hypothetical protein
MRGWVFQDDRNSPHRAKERKEAPNAVCVTVSGANIHWPANGQGQPHEGNSHHRNDPICVAESVEGNLQVGELHFRFSCSRGRGRSTVQESISANYLETRHFKPFIPQLSNHQKAGTYESGQEWRSNLPKWVNCIPMIHEWANHFAWARSRVNSRELWLDSLSRSWLGLSR